jgi:hypothetical protein
MQSNTQIDQFLNQSRLALLGALQDADVGAAIEPYGYDEEALQELLGVLDDAEALYQKQHQGYAEQYAATATFDEKVGALAQKFARHRRLARVAFSKDEPAYAALGLRGRRARDFDGLMQQATGFYTVLREQPDVLDRLVPLTVDAAAVESAFKDIEAVQLAKASQRVGIREAQAATQTRDDAIADLQGRMSDFFEIARIATTDNPQLRESLGIVTPA